MIVSFPWNFPGSLKFILIGCLEKTNVKWVRLQLGKWKSKWAYAMRKKMQLFKEKKQQMERVTTGLRTGRTNGRWQCCQTWTHRGGPCVAIADWCGGVMRQMLGVLGISNYLSQMRMVVVVLVVAAAAAVVEETRINNTDPHSSFLPPSLHASALKKWPSRKNGKYRP